MRPARIHVFDGLRVATEHIDHLQDGLQSSIEDIREVIGLGRVLHGFDVQPQGNDAIVVGPGLAFDHDRNRLVIDEPQHVDVTFSPGQEARYLCARYQRVEDGEVEGRPTLVWDSASLVLNDSLPSPADALIPIAKLERSQDASGPSFRIVGLTPPGNGTAPIEPAGSGADGEPGAVEALAEPLAADGEPAPVADKPAEADPAAEQAPTDAGDAATASARPALRLRQGVVHLPPDAGADAKGDSFAALVAALRESISTPQAGDVRATLGSEEVEVDFPLAGLTCDSSVSAEVRGPEGEPRRCSVSAHGEATFDGGSVAQFGLANGELTELGLARLSLAGADAGTDDILGHVGLAVHASPAAHGFRLVCDLVWTGDVSEDRVQALEKEAAGLSWGARIGWKALGA